jgi:hypothetical protein
LSLLFFYPYYIMSNFSTKIASTVSVVALVATTMSASLVSAASEFLPYAELLADNSVISSQSNESGYRLGDTITRAEIAKITANLGGFTATACAGTVFGDVSASLGDLCGSIEALAEAGVVSTANANFRPNASVTRAEATKMLLGAVGEAPSTESAGYMDTASLGDLAGYIDRANELGCAATATYFRPNATSSRGEAFKLAACVGGFEATTPVVPPTPTVTGSTTTGSTVAGTVSVALDGTAVAQYVPYNASNVKVGAIKLTAGTADATVTSVVISRSGLGPVGDIDNIALATSGTIVSNNAAVNQTSQTATVRLSPSLVIKAGTSVSLDVLVSLKSSAQPNSQHQFTATTVNTTGGAATTPVTLGLLNTTSYSVGAVNIDGLTTSTVTSGKTGQRFLNVKLSTNKDTTINGFTLTRSAGEDVTKAFSNVVVYKNGSKVGTVVTTSDKIMVSGLNTALLNGETADYELRADVVYVGAASTITLKIENSSDVSATEKTTGYAMTTANAPVTANSSIALPAVQLTWTKTSTGSQTVSPGTSSVELFNAKYSADASFDVTSFTVAGSSTDAQALTTTTLAQAQFSRLTLSVAGIDYDMLALTAAQGTPASATFSSTSDKFTVDSGSPVIVKITGTLKSNATSGKSYKYTATINTVKNNTNSSTVTPTNNSQAGDTVNVANGKATFKSAAVAAPSTKKISANQSRTEIGRFSIFGEAEDINVRKLVLTNAVGTTGSATLTAAEVADLTALISGNTVKIVDVDTGLDVASVATVATSSITLDSLAITVPKDVTKTYKVLVDTTALTGLSGKKFTLRVAAVTSGDITRVSSGNADVAGSVLATSNTTGEFVGASTTYVVGKVPPTVSIVKSGTDLDTYVVTVRNIDSENAMDITDVTIKAKSRFAGSTTVTWDGMACVRNGATGQCGVSGVSTASANIVTGATFTLASVVPNLTLAKNTGNTTFNVYIPNLPALIAGDTLEVAVTGITYDTSSTEDYTGVAGSKVTATK